MDILSLANTQRTTTVTNILAHPLCRKERILSHPIFLRIKKCLAQDLI